VTSVFWYEPLLGYLQQVVVHSAVLGAILFIWAHRIDLPPGATKRHLLALLLVLPMLTAAVPGRGAPEFHERFAWLDSGRVLAIPIGAGLHVSHVAIAIALFIFGLTLWQEVWPPLRRRHQGGGPVPERLMTIVRERAGWADCRIAMTASDGVLLATGGWPGRSWLHVSYGALEALSDDELTAVVRHEHAHWRAGRWVYTHLLFLVRLFQCYNPIALWGFRAYCLEVEIACDAEAVAGREARLLVKPLLRIYESTDRRDTAARGALRRRVNTLIAGRVVDEALPPATVAAVAVVMLMVLPWLV
jgi:hypothetical protein